MKTLSILLTALLLPTLGGEWRINSDFGIRLDGSLSHWGGPPTKAVGTTPPLKEGLLSSFTRH